VLAAQQLVCTGFGVVAMQLMPEERKKLRISRHNYLTMLLPFTIVLSAKLFLQNKAVQYVSPAFYAMTGQLLPVGVTIAGFLTGSQKFKWSTVCAAAVVSVGGILIKAGQMELSPFGFILTMSSLVLDVVRLLLMQHLLQPLRLTGIGMMLLSAPQQCILFCVNAVWTDVGAIARRMQLTEEQGGFGGEFMPIVGTVCALAVGVVLFNLFFVKMTSAIISAICTPFKDLCTIIMSDLFVDPRTETPRAMAGFGLACTASFAYNVHDIYARRKAKESEEEEKKPLLEEEGRVGATGKGGSDEVNDGGEGDDAGGEGDWTYRDAYVVGFTCCGAGIVVYATALWWHLNRL
jgi:drug/metabolite transporter (DMT)-like permease